MSMSPITSNCTESVAPNQGKPFSKTTFGRFDVPSFGRFEYHKDGLTVERCNSYFILIMEFKRRKTKVVSPTTKFVKFNAGSCKRIIFIQVYSQCNLTQEVMEKVKLQSRYFEMFNESVQDKFYLNVSHDNRLQCPICNMCISSIDYFNSHFTNTIPNYKWYRRYISKSGGKLIKRIQTKESRKELFGHESQTEIEAIYNNCFPLSVSHFNKLKIFTDALEHAKSNFETIFLQNDTNTMPKK